MALSKPSFFSSIIICFHLSSDEENGLGFSFVPYLLLCGVESPFITATENFKKLEK
jgi:hypothetical protein